MNVGIRVKMSEHCECVEYRNDLKDCFHQPCTVRHIFRDKVSVWIQNPYGFARMAQSRDLTVL